MNNILGVAKKAIFDAKWVVTHNYVFFLYLYYIIFFFKKFCVPRKIEILKSGGVLPLIQILTDVLALGALTGGAASVVKFARDFSKFR